LTIQKKQFRNYKVVYRRYAGLFFCLCVDANDNELAYLEAIHLFVEILGMSAFVSTKTLTFS
jgi:AP-2 complex subunit sigma-1